MNSDATSGEKPLDILGIAMQQQETMNNRTEEEVPVSPAEKACCIEVIMLITLIVLVQLT